MSLGVRSASYGKAGVRLCRTIRPADGHDREPSVVPVEVDVDLGGSAFVASYTDGDNTSVVATDSMRNLIVAAACASADWTLEPLLHDIARRFADEYPQVERVRIAGRRPLLDSVGTKGRPLFRRWESRAALAEMAFTSAGMLPEAMTLVSGVTGLRLLRLGGSSFVGFVRDRYTTLAEDSDRDLFVDLDVRWRAQQVRDLIEAPVVGEAVEAAVEDVTSGFDSRSIQHLLHEVGRVLMERFPLFAELSLTGRNCGWSPVRTSCDDTSRIYVEPPDMQGVINLDLTRS
jgi:urate oxidase/2-oxo-4-hydroxy-4-carboxy-5-ureidoimidazoline decarboxylase